MSSSGENRKHISIILLGHVDCGKSTLGGHLLYKQGAVDTRTIIKFEREASDLGKGSFKYSWVLSKLKSERERGISIDVSWWFFDSGKYDVTVLDVGGHRDFLRNTLTGMSQADVAIMVIDGSLGAFEAGISAWGQTREHILCAYALGLKEIIVLVNKMDDRSVNYREARFNEISEEVRRILKEVGYKPENVPIVPISAWTGENLVESSPNMPWWMKGKTKWGGMTFLKVLNMTKIYKSQRKNHFPLRIPVSDSFKISGIGTVLVGRIDTGTVTVGDVIELSPCQRKLVVKSIEKNHASKRRAFAGERVGIGVYRQGVHSRSVRRGFVIGSPHNNPPRVCEKMEVQIVNIRHYCIKVGYEPTVDCKTNHARYKIEKIISKIDKKTGAVLEENPKGLYRREMGVVLMTNQLSSPTQQKVEMVTEPFPHSSFGRIVIRDNRTVVAVGVVKRVFKRGIGWCSTFNSSGSESDEDEKERREYIIEASRETVFCCTKFIGCVEEIIVWKSLLFS